MCKQRRNFPAHADSWHLRFHWDTIRSELLQTLNSQNYTFLPLNVVTKANGETLHLWSSQDALVLKMLAIALPDALSPVIAAYYLKGLDEQMEGDTRYFYRRFMDDVIVLAKTRWHLRKAVRIVNQHFNQLKVAQAPDKPFIGRIEKGFDFLGYRFGQEKLSVSKRTLENHIRRLSTTLGYMGLCSYSVVDA
ncbi:reverse transcriptase domain-containing protein [Glaciecola sp. 33A]|uniref:reverse transcriptase domain-containing protein n=1 Tax=Glaciecola sp. 33A TaxID=2057807 RepID=UPI000C321D00|nr:reverse transcriptase domain-containing protein [Glaciecola sp. 33A]PKI03746.1 hypothetical protein CXF81_00215 [Glaciecola sp. 33A]